MLVPNYFYAPNTIERKSTGLFSYFFTAAPSYIKHSLKVWTRNKLNYRLTESK